MSTPLSELQREQRHSQSRPVPVTVTKAVLLPDTAKLPKTPPLLAATTPCDSLVIVNDEDNNDKDSEDTLKDEENHCGIVVASPSTISTESSTASSTATSSDSSITSDSSSSSDGRNIHSNDDSTTKRALFDDNTNFASASATASSTSEKLTETTATSASASATLTPVVPIVANTITTRTATSIVAVRNRNSIQKKKKKSALQKAASALTPHFLKSKKKKRMEAFTNSMTAEHAAANPNAVQWLESSCPKDVVPKVLAYLAPATTQALMATNAYWFQLIARNDGTWRTLCEAMYKWKEGRDELPTTSWKDYYRMRPCVPTDYRSIPNALAVATAHHDDNNKMSPSSSSSSSSKKKASSRVGGYSQYLGLGSSSSNSSSNSSSSNNQKNNEQVRSVHVLLRPGTHILEEAMLIQATTDDVCITISTIELPKDRFYSPRLAFQEHQRVQSCPALAISSTNTRRRNSSTSSAKSLLHLMQGCRSVRGVVDSTDQPPAADAHEELHGSTRSMESGEAGIQQQRHNSERGTQCTGSTTQTLSSTTIPFFVVPPSLPTRARVVLRTRRYNEPILRVRQGLVKLVRVDLEHASAGVDIWSGNAAIQIQPPMGPDGVVQLRNATAADGGDEDGNATPLPSAELDNVGVSSRSGRGVVCLDGSHVDLRDSMIFDCAATGLYVGGRGSEASMTRSDVIRNGIGSRLPPSRAPSVTPGHSGVYLEQGTARIQSCNISSNSLTGISAVSHDNAVLMLDQSDMVANGQQNLERPPPGTAAYRLSEVSNNNNLASVGRPCLRSNLELPHRRRSTRVRTSTA